MRRTMALRLALALILVLAIGGIVYALAGGEPAGEVAAPRPSATPASVPSETEAAPEPTVPSRTVDPEPAVMDGIYAVGSEIKPGTYSTTAGTRACYWARLRSFGQPNSIIDEANLAPGEHVRVVVKPSDQGFKVSNGCTWHQARGE